MQAYTLTIEDLEATADAVKVCILADLVAENLLNSGVAESWAATHTVIARRKSFFRTLTKLWQNTSEGTGVYWLVVAAKYNPTSDDDKKNKSPAKVLEFVKKPSE